ncbi:MAG: DUF4298 domain-containing protein [Campylobacter sp.]|nr:DUF4298 domain-containing protein [Campylobacter sp.]
MNQIERIEKMSEFLKEVQNTQKEFEIALENFKNSQKMMKKLSRYYFGGAWRKDYEADEKGKIPKEIPQPETNEILERVLGEKFEIFAPLNRGALSEDGIYNAFCENKYLAKQMQKIAKEILKNK